MALFWYVVKFTCNEMPILSIHSGSSNEGKHLCTSNPCEDRQPTVPSGTSAVPTWRVCVCVCVICFPVDGYLAICSFCPHKAVRVFLRIHVFFWVNACVHNCWVVIEEVNVQLYKNLPGFSPGWLSHFLPPLSTREHVLVAVRFSNGISRRF